MALDILKERGTPLEKQEFDWRDLVRAPYSKLDDDAFTRVRVILMNGIESEAVRFGHACARMNGPALQQALARVRRIEHHQQTLVNWLNPPDQDPLETTLGFEQVAIEITANVAQNEPDPYLKEVYDFGLLEDFDHLYRYSALYDRLYGRDPNTLLQSYTDIIPGRPTSVEHRAPIDDLRNHYDRRSAAPETKIHACTIMAAENQTHDFYMTIGPMFSDPIARQLYAEIASIEEQHVTQYESIIDPHETWIEKWLLHEATEVWNYWGCYQSEPNPRIKQIWERFLSYELGHLHAVMDIMRKVERRDPEALLPESMPDPIAFESQRIYVREALARGVALRANGTSIVPPEEESEASIAQRERLNKSGSPSEIVAAGYQYVPGGELTVMPPAALEGPLKMQLPTEAENETPFTGKPPARKGRAKEAKRNGKQKTREAHR
jgi:rubrerythrin